MKEELEVASQEEERLRSDLIRSALKHYIRDNPDGVKVFDRNKLATKRSETNRTSESSDTTVNGIYDPSKEI
jgi:metal-responsive CopG/Arc/MetJ family transcriptional regulator